MPNLSRQFLFEVNAGIVSTSTSIPSNAIPLTSGTTFLSLPEKGDGYFGSGDGLHTVSYTIQAGFDGSISMQGTLVVAPTAQDWFDIPGTTSTYTLLSSSNVTTYANFTGNFVWVRAKVVKNLGTLVAINYNR